MESLGLDVATIALMEDWRDKVEKFGEWKRQEEICASVINHWSGGHDTEHGEVRKDELTRWKGEHDTARKELEGAKASMMSAKDRLDQRVLAVTRESRDSKKRLNSEIAKLTQLLSRKSREGTNQDGENAVVEPVVEEDDPHPKTCGTVEGTGNVGGGAVEKRGGCDGEQPSPSSADGNVQREGNGDVEAVESGNDTGVATSEEHDGGEGKQLSPPLADGNVEREGNGDVQAGGIGDGKTPSLPECSRKRVQRKMIGGADGDVGPSKRPKRAAAAAAAAVGATRLTTVRRASRKTAIAGDEEEEQADADAGEKCGHGNAVDDQEEEGDEDEEGGGSGHGFLPALLNGRKDESKTCYSDEVWEEMVHHFQGETVTRFRTFQKKKFFEEGVNFPYNLVKPNEKGEFPDIFYTRVKDSSDSAYNGQWVLGWLKEGKTELPFKVIATSKPCRNVETLLKNKSGLGFIVSDSREIYRFKPVKLMTKGMRKRA